MQLLVISDIHYAGEAEKARKGWEARAIRQRFPRLVASVYRRYVWLADPTAHNHQVERFIERAGDADLIVANGDYSCDSGFIGLADDAAFASAEECLGRLRTAFGERLLATIGDHELGKMSLFGGAGGLRLESWRRTTAELRLLPAWRHSFGRYDLIGVTSTLLALPVFEPEILDSERQQWNALRQDHMESLRNLFREVGPDRRVILFCHDPTALPFLAADPVLKDFLPQVACTIIGHLHSTSVLKMGNWLAGMPELKFMGNTARRLSVALRRARKWSAFRVVLCPSLAGIQLLKDGGFLELRLSSTNGEEPAVQRHRLPW